MNFCLNLSDYVNTHDKIQNLNILKKYEYSTVNIIHFSWLLRRTYHDSPSVMLLYVGIQIWCPVPSSNVSVLELRRFSCTGFDTVHANSVSLLFGRTCLRLHHPLILQLYKNIFRILQLELCSGLELHLRQWQRAEAYYYKFSFYQLSTTQQHQETTGNSFTNCSLPSSWSAIVRSRSGANWSGAESRFSKKMSGDEFCKMSRCKHFELTWKKPF